jgi:hypothetical protein
VPYICVRKGSRTKAEQAATLATAGLTDAELAEPWVEDLTAKPRKGETPRDEWTRMLGSLRAGDEVWIERPGIVATTAEEALTLLAELAEDGARICTAATGRCYGPDDPSSMVRFAADVVADARAMTLEKARAAIRSKRPRQRASGFTDKQWKWAEDRWTDSRWTRAQIAAETGISGSMLTKRFGPRGTPIFGKLPQKKGRRK